LDGKQLIYYLVRKEIKTVRLTVDNEMRAVVSAPAYVSQKKIGEFVLKHKDFIEKNILKRQEAKDLHDVDTLKTGEQFLLFGKQTKIVSKSYIEDKVFLEGDILYILLEENTSEARQAHFDQFIKKAAKMAFNVSLTKYYPKFSDKIKEKPKITARMMKTKWGSANPSRNRITMNTALVFAPKRLIDYVMVHELCHFYHLDHSKAFYAKLSEIVPDYKEKRKELRETYGYLI